MSDLRRALSFARRYPLVTIGGTVMLALALTGTGAAQAAVTLAFLLVFIPLGLAAKALLRHLDK